MAAADWIAVDWGTTHLRAVQVVGGTARAEAASDKGMATLSREEFEPALLQLIDGWLATDRATQVLVCGMAGARQGWAEAPYRKVPCPPLDGALTRVAVRDPRLDVHIVPGLAQSSPPDVMRGEETQIAGFLALNPGWDGVICLPGTHSKWCHVSAGEVVSFQTYMTGELFALLGTQSVLRHSAGGGGWQPDVFGEAISDTLSNPETLAARLFRLRADHLLNGTGGEVTRSRLSGLLIGAELAGARPYWLGQQVAVVGAGPLAQAYVAALALQGVPATLLKSDAATLAGLKQARTQLETTT